MSDLGESYNNRIKNKLFGLLCEFEKDREWEKFLDAIIVELMGIEESRRSINYVSLMNKLASLRYLRYEYFRTTVFDCMNLLGKDNELF